MTGPRGTIPTEALAAAFLEDDVSIEDAVDALGEFTRELLDNTVYEGGVMVQDSIGFSAGDGAKGAHYLEAVNTAEATGTDLPIGYHLAWAQELAKYGNTQLGGVDKVDKFVRRLEAEASKRGDVPVGKIRDASAGRVKGGGGYLVSRDARSGQRIYAVQPPQGLYAKTVLQKAQISRDMARLAKTEQGQWVVAVNPVHAIEVANRIEAAFPDLAKLAQAVRDVAPVWQAAAGVGAAPAPAAPSTRTVKLPLTGGVVPYEGFIAWSPDKPRVAKLNITYDDLQRLIRSKALAGIPERYQPEADPKHPGADHRGTVHYRLYDVNDYQRVADAYGTVVPRMADEIRRLGAIWMTKQPKVSQEARYRAWALLQRFRHMLAPEMREDERAQNTMLDRIVEVLPQLLEIEPKARQIDLGPYGKVQFTSAKGKPALRIYSPFEFKDYYLKGPMRVDPVTGDQVYSKLRSLDWGKDQSGRYNAYAMRNIVDLTYALDRVGNLPMSVAIRLAYLTDDVSRGTDLRLEMLARSPSTEDIQDPALKKEVQAIGARLDKIMAPMKLRPFQRITPAFVYFTGADPTNLGMRAYIGDDMGLGKTPQAIASLLLDRVTDADPMTPAVVVAPASTLINWMREIEKFGGGLLRPTLFEGGRVPQMEYGEVMVISESLLRDYVDDILAAGFRTVVADEAHYFKNLSAERTQEMIRLAHGLPNVIYLSGTPLPNKPEDLWAQLHALDATLFPDFKAFRARFASDRKTREIETPGGGTVRIKQETKDRKAVDAELADILRTIMVRRFKTDVAKELPKKTRQTVWVPLDAEARRLYEQAKARFEDIAAANFIERMSLEAAKRVLRGSLPLAQAAAWANDQRAEGDGGILVQMNVLRQTTGKLKVPALVEQIREFKQNNPDSPLLVFYEHGEVADLVERALKRSKLRIGRVDGGTPKKDRQALFDQFNRRDLDVLLGSRAMIEGVNLQHGGADVLFAERWWVPTAEAQAEDRVYRIGQNRPVLARYLMAADTFDEDMAELIEAKRQTIAGIVGVQDVHQARTSIPVDEAITRLPGPWQDFAKQHRDALEASGGHLAAGDDAIRGDAVGSIAQQVARRVLRKLRQRGKAVVTDAHIRSCIQHLQRQGFGKKSSRSK